MLLKIKLGFRLMLTMAPNIPQCTLIMIVIETGPPFHLNGVKSQHIEMKFVKKSPKSVRLCCIAGVTKVCLFIKGWRTRGQQDFRLNIKGAHFVES